MQKLCVLHISSVKNEKSGGVGFVVPNYVYYQNKYAKTALLDIQNSYSKYKNNMIFNFNKYSSISSLPSPFNNPDIVIFHEVYKKEYLKLYKECISCGIPYIVVPHGCMTKYAQKSKIIKKTIGNILFFKKFLNKACAIHYLSNVERDLSKAGKKNFVCGNGIIDPNVNYYAENKPFTLCFMGRYNVYHKGIDLLLKSVKLIEQWFRDNRIIINMYGMGSEKNCRFIYDFVKNNEISDIVKVNGPVFGENKELAFEKTSMFILTSRFEGQPQGIHEALIRGIPCIVTPGTSFGEYIEKNNCGYYSQGNIEAIANAIKEAYDNRDKLKNMSEEARKCIKRDYLWDTIAEKNISIYKNFIKTK